MSGILNAFSGGSYGKPPGAPTIGTATAGNAFVCVFFTAPSCTGIPSSITGYQTVCVATGTNTATGSSSPIQLTGLTNCSSYQFKVRATNATGYGAYSGNSNSVTPTAKGSVSYTTPGTYSWVAPAGVTSVSVVAVGGGGGGAIGTCLYCCSIPATVYAGGTGAGGGGLGYKNNYSVTPGNSYTVVVGAGGAPTHTSFYPSAGNTSYFVSTCVVYGGRATAGGNVAYGGLYGGDGGGNGGNAPCSGFCNTGGPGGGAGGYSGNGGSNTSTVYTPSSGGGGGAGNTHAGTYHGGTYQGNGGGGVGLFGQGSNGAVGAWPTPAGGGGSGGGGGGIYVFCGYGGSYGGGGGGGSYNLTGGSGGGGAVRIVWPGNTRTFPSTCVGSP
jgi:hypothetical protein